MIYEIIIVGYINEAWFEGFTLIKLPNFTTVLRGHLVDQSALYGVLRTINNLGLDLISINRLEEEVE